MSGAEYFAGLGKWGRIAVEGIQVRSAAAEVVGVGFGSYPLACFAAVFVPE